MASLGAIANLLLILILSLYMVADRDRLLASLFRLVPPAVQGGGRGPRAERRPVVRRLPPRPGDHGLVYAAVAVIASAIFGLDYLAGTSAAAGLLMAIPFFGPFVAWAPPVLVALFTKPEATLGTLVVMAVGWLLVMNILQPRLMPRRCGSTRSSSWAPSSSAARSPGSAGAIFGIPIAAVLSALLLHSIGRNVEGSPVAAARQRLGRREGRRSASRASRPGDDATWRRPPRMPAPRGRASAPSPPSRRRSSDRVRAPWPICPTIVGLARSRRIARRWTAGRAT